MKVKCIAKHLNVAQKKILGIQKDEEPQYPFSVGEIYTVLGIHTQLGYYSGIILKIHVMYPVPAPLCLFEIIDERVSSYWKVKKLSEYELALWPEEFYQDFFQDDLTTGVPEVVNIYRKVLERLEKEFDE